MILNHINLTVSDVRAAAAFLEKYFGLQNQGGNGGFMLLFDDHGMVITLMKGKEINYPATFHIGFDQGSREQVNEMNARMKADGFDVKPPTEEHAWTYYVKAPGGFTVEVMSA